eukprot:30706-Pelagococcus_subviridis.AAC.18
MSSSNAAAAQPYAYTPRKFVLKTKIIAATPPTLSGMSTKNDSTVTSVCLPCPEKTPPVHRLFNTPNVVASSATGSTFAASLATTRSLVASDSTGSANGATNITTATSVADTTAVDNQNERRAASPSPRPR